MTIQFPTKTTDPDFPGLILALDDAGAFAKRLPKAERAKRERQALDAYFDAAADKIIPSWEQ